jgi:hypothetical protein
MVSITADTLIDLLNDDDLADEDAENILDMAIDCLNLFNKDLDLSNMQGDAGSKTLSVDSRVRGAILLVANQIYLSIFRVGSSSGASGSSSTSYGLGGLSYSQSASSNITSSLLNNPEVLTAVKEAASQLSEIEVSKG